jgi:hypothetical protein
MGFTLTTAEAHAMLDADSKNSEVIFPYLNGQDLNTDPEQRPSRWVISFWDWPEERAREYELPWKRVEEHVKPERQKLNDKNSTGRRRKRYWWQYGGDAKNLYHAIGRGHHFEKHPKGWDPKQQSMERVLAVTRVSKTLAFSFVPAGIVFSDATVAFSLNGYDDFAVLQSGLYAPFAWQHSSRLKSDLRYSPTDALEPFAFPDVKGSDEEQRLTELGSSYDQARRDWMLAEDQGLTKLYRQYHDTGDTESRIDNLRDLHREIDLAVARAYGWDDLDLGHGYHEVPYLPENDRLRYTISEPARIEVLRRLAELNRQRYEEEVAQGLHGQIKPAAKQHTSKTAQNQSALDLGDLLNFDMEP